LDVFDARLHELERHPGAPELVPHREPLHFGEFAEEAHPQTACGLVADEADEVSRHKIVAVEFFLDWTVLLGEIDRRTDRGHEHEIIGIACDPNRYRARRTIGVQRGSSAVHLRSSSLRELKPAWVLAGDSMIADSTRDRAGSSASA